MHGADRWSRILVIVGFVAMVIGVLDPLEGSLVILPGTGLAALGAGLGNSRHRIPLYWSFALVAAGVGAMWGLSALGGFGGISGRSNWWGRIGKSIGVVEVWRGFARRVRRPGGGPGAVVGSSAGVAGRPVGPGRVVVAWRELHSGRARAPNGPNR